MRVLAGMSGGVDSSAAALILKEKGYEVIGCTMKHWGKKSTSIGIFDALNEKLKSKNKADLKGACLCPDEDEDIEQAQSVCRKIGIDFHVIDCAEAYEEIVLKYFKDEYAAGRTPNPCVRCNRYIKFGVLPELAKKAGIQFDKFASGHYARIEEKNGRFYLKRGIDAKKDQSYFLYGLSQEQLSRILLPVGDYTKSQIREIARKNGLASADKPDSQDFYNGSYNDILDFEPKQGNITDVNGNILGTHLGYWNYTIGQRRGIGVSAAKPLYVKELRKDTNEVIVSYKDDAVNEGLTAENAVFNLEGIESGMRIKCSVKVRSTQEPRAAQLEFISTDKVKVIFDEFQNPIAIGQSAVFYDNDTVLGGGIIESVF